MYAVHITLKCRITQMGHPQQGPRIGVGLNSCGLLVQEEVRLIGGIEWRGWLVLGGVIGSGISSVRFGMAVVIFCELLQS